MIFTKRGASESKVAPNWIPHTENQVALILDRWLRLMRSLWFFCLFLTFFHSAPDRIIPSASRSGSAGTEPQVLGENKNQTLSTHWKPQHQKMLECGSRALPRCEPIRSISTHPSAAHCTYKQAEIVTDQPLSRLADGFVSKYHVQWATLTSFCSSDWKLMCAEKGHFQHTWADVELPTKNDSLSVGHSKEHSSRFGPAKKHEEPPRCQKTVNTHWAGRNMQPFTQLAREASLRC